MIYHVQFTARDAISFSEILEISIFLRVNDWPAQSVHTLQQVIGVTDLIYCIQVQYTAHFYKQISTLYVTSQLR